MAGPTISGFVIPGSVAVWDGADIQFDVTPNGGGSYSNPYKSSIVKVDATITTPGGTVVTTTMPCVFEEGVTIGANTSGHGQTYTLQGSTARHFWLHYRFPSAGIWTIKVTAVDAGGTTTSTNQTITVAGSRADKLSPWRVANTLYLTWADGTPLIPIGNNVAVEDRDYTLDGSVGYAKWFNYIGANGGNVARYLVSAYHRNGIVWSSTGAQYSGWDNFFQGLGVFSQINAKRIDEAFRIAALNGVSLLFCGLTHGEFSTSSDARWTDSPWNSAHGGPVNSSDPALFLTDATSLVLWKDVLRYYVGRWFGRPAMGAYEHVNEGGTIGNGFFVGNNNLVGGAVVNQATWVQTCRDYLHSIDPFGILQTWSEEWDPSLGQELTPNLKTDPIFQLLDFATAHVYTNGPWLSNDRRHNPGDMIRNMQLRLSMPALHMETASYRSPSAPEPNFNPSTSLLSQIQKDHLLAGTHVHQTLLANLASGFIAGHEWWHGAGEAENAAQNRTSGTLPYGSSSGPPYSFPLNTALLAAAAIAAGENPGGWPVVGAPITCTVPASLSYRALGYNQRALGYVADAVNNYQGSEEATVAGRTISGASCTVAGLLDGAYNVEVWSTRGTAGLLQTLSASSVGGSLTFVAPTIDRDAFYKIYPQSGGGGGPSGAANVYDSGTRTVAPGGLGSADIGGAWTIGGTAADYSVNGSQLVIVGSAAGVTRRGWLSAATWQNQDWSAQVQTDKVPTGASQANYLMLRAQSLEGDFYRVICSFTATNAITLSIEKVIGGVNTLVAGTVTPGRDTFTINTEFRVRAQAEDAFPTILRAKVWKVGTIEPVAWDLVGTDASAALLQGMGAVGIRNYVGAATNTPVTFRWDELIGIDIANPNPNGSAAFRVVRQARHRASSF